MSDDYESNRRKVLDFVLTKKYGAWQPIKLVRYGLAFMGKETFLCRCDCGHEQEVQICLLKAYDRRPRCEKCYKHKRY